MSRSVADSLKEIIRNATGRTADIVRVAETGGGSISRAFVVETLTGKWFVKLNRGALLGMFEAEADGLLALAECADIRVPGVAGCGCSGEHAWLVLEYLEMHPIGTSHRSAATAGQALAAQHRIARKDYGWHRDNFIGSTPQSNRRHGDWAEFFACERLLPQLALAEINAAPVRLIDGGRRLADRMASFFGSYRPQPSLLHGDLWGGNAALDHDGKLVLFDPAVYFGDREADLAMTELFGGFPPAFHAAYREAWPLEDGYAQRRTLYNLYHVLNHFNLFGGGYGQQAGRMIDALLAEAG